MPKAFDFVCSSMAERRRTAKRLAYLGTVDKLIAALANEYGADVKMPSRKELQAIIDERKARFTKFHDECERRATP